jgi:hypothetical protein
MTEPPTYTVAADFNEIEQLREVIDALRANNGRLLRLLIKRLSNDPRPEAKELVETIVHHPQLQGAGPRSRCSSLATEQDPCASHVRIERRRTDLQAKAKTGRSGRRKTSLRK